MRLLKQDTAYNLMVFMADSSDHVTGKVSLTLTITASKDGAAFGAITPTVTERGNGWYNLALTSAHTDTLGDLALHITGTDADPTDLVSQIIAADLAVANIPANVKAISDDTTAANNAESFFDGTGYAGTNNTIPTVTTLTNKTGFSLSSPQTFDVIGNITGNLSGSVGSVTGNVGGNVVGSVASVTANVTIGDIVAAALAKFFATNSGTTYAAAVAGSVVKEIADNSGGGSGIGGSVID